MSGTVHGDPASCSQLGGTLRQLATRLRTSGRAAHDAFDGSFDRPSDRPSDLGGAGSRAAPVLMQARRRVDVLDAGAAAAAREVDRVGAALQAHASDLAEAVAESRALAQQAQAAGLRVVDGELVAVWGVSGVADGTATAQRDAAREQLQARLDAVAALVGQRRHRLAATLRQSQAVLATHAGALRR
ncbi:hypothetical protein BJ986_002220 [Phycicoccus badiiscoriae]|uniref:Uncharacterized protein n=1 Tax=Pedococcus badiiscoriae TaxID=642776 RepID=A0A852WES9_9MICO|nr:hypothetical protein [Pedococcus badiiscoriae]NYG07733.1 hypothetical protein [Pedococcus badiiscoriae]